RGLVSEMADSLLPALLEACVVVGASSDKLQEICQVFTINDDETLEHLLLEPEVLSVLAPPFVSRTQAESEMLRSHGKLRRSFIRKKRELPPSAAPTPSRRGGIEDVSVPKNIDLMALPQLCFPGGLQVTSEQKEEQFHFLVFTDILGNKTHGVVMQCYRMSLYRNGRGSSKCPKLFCAYSICVISKHPYFTALKDCLSW
uniref:UDENN domain-containing protein n=1 Tax=Haplochromis burtoni TaxID=8153 RepID=A0A3Q2WYP8_HAPBU